MSKNPSSTKSVEKKLEKVDWRAFGDGVIGVDEVGRGCLAGPVYAAAVFWTQDHEQVKVTDSKLLTPQRREELAHLIRQNYVVAVGQACAREIEELNILQASLLAMHRAIEGVEKQLEGKTDEPISLLVDGNQKIPSLPRERQFTLIKGDLRCAPISAASIVAKVARDQMMKEQASIYPQYGFESHKGYLTKKHQLALAKWGPCEIHRRSFAGVKELL